MVVCHWQQKNAANRKAAVRRIESKPPRPNWVMAAFLLLSSGRYFLAADGGTLGIPEVGYGIG